MWPFIQVPAGANQTPRGAAALQNSTQAPREIYVVVEQVRTGGPVRELGASYVELGSGR